MGMTVRMFPEREAPLWMRETSHGQVPRLFKQKPASTSLCLPTVGAVRHSCYCKYGCYCIETLHHPDELYSHSMTQNKPSDLRLLFKRYFFRTTVKKTSNTSGCNLSRNFTPRTLTTLAPENQGSLRRGQGRWLCQVLPCISAMAVLVQIDTCLIYSQPFPTACALCLLGKGQK